MVQSVMNSILLSGKMPLVPYRSIPESPLAVLVQEQVPLLTLRFFHLIFHVVLKKYASKTVFFLFVSIGIFTTELIGA